MKIKNYYILKKIFINLKNNKFLEIIKYNKILQKRLKININDYIEYSQIYSSIEIELKIEDNKYCQFINIPDGDKEYYHIYLLIQKKKLKELI